MLEWRSRYRRRASHYAVYGRMSLCTDRALSVTSLLLDPIYTHSRVKVSDIIPSVGIASRRKWRLDNLL
jgi:hypothetical protein